MQHSQSNSSSESALSACMLCVWMYFGVPFLPEDLSSKRLFFYFLISPYTCKNCFCGIAKPFHGGYNSVK